MAGGRELGAGGLPFGENASTFRNASKVVDVFEMPALRRVCRRSGRYVWKKSARFDVLPEVPLRQWVLTVPFSLRCRLGFDRKATGLLIRCFHRALRRHMTHRAKQALGLGSVTDAKVGAIAFVQRFDSALRLNVHLHTLVLDGVFLDGQFHPMQLPRPQQDGLYLGRSNRADVGSVGNANGPTLF